MKNGSNVISINSNVQVHVQKQIHAYSLIYIYEIYNILTKGKFSIGEGLTFLVTVVYIIYNVYI
jgi:hypothetical protein